jgi:hypothetical protein
VLGHSWTLTRPQRGLDRRGLNAKQVQVWLGHHSPAFTLETYVHLLSDDLPETPFGDSDIETIDEDSRTSPPVLVASVADNRAD